MIDELEKTNDVNQPGSLQKRLFYVRYLLKNKCGKVIETIKPLSILMENETPINPDEAIISNIM